MAGCTTTTGTATPTTTQTTLSTTTPIGPPDDPEGEVILTAIEIFKSYLDFGHFDKIADFYLDTNAQELTSGQKELVMERWISIYGADHQDYSIVSLYISPPQEQDVGSFLLSHDVLLHYDLYVTFMQQRGDGDELIYTPHRENLDVVFKDGRWWLLLMESL